MGRWLPKQSPPSGGSYVQRATAAQPVTFVFAKGIAVGLGITEPVVSPTFAIVREYEGRVPVAHVDVYRLDRVQELHDLGLEEIFDGSRVVLVEWGDLVGPLLPGDRVVVRLRAGADDDDDARTIEVTAEGSPRSASLEAQLASALAAAIDRDIPSAR